MIRKTGRIFAIGLPKTGTLSLHHALLRLGFRSIHYPIDDVIPRLHQGDYGSIGDYEAFINCGEWHFAAINNIYPDARFIYTWRDYDQWLISVKRHFHHYETPGLHTSPYRNRLEVFGTAVFNEHVMKTIYEAHRFAVEQYFSGRDNLLKLNVAEKDAYARLCRYLGTPVIEEAFPHENRARLAAGGE